MDANQCLTTSKAVATVIVCIGILIFNKGKIQPQERVQQIYRIEQKKNNCCLLETKYVLYPYGLLSEELGDSSEVPIGAKSNLLLSGVNK